jgi:hypothetical protein
MLVTLEFAEEGTNSATHRVLIIGHGTDDLQAGDISLSVDEAKTLPAALYAGRFFGGLNQKISSELLPTLARGQIAPGKIGCKDDDDEDDKLSTKPGQLQCSCADLGDNRRGCGLKTLIRRRSPKAVESPPHQASRISMAKKRTLPWTTNASYLKRLSYGRENYD